MVEGDIIILSMSSHSCLTDLWGNLEKNVSQCLTSGNDLGEVGGEGLDDGGGVLAGDEIGVKNCSEFGVLWDG